MLGPISSQLVMTNPKKLTGHCTVSGLSKSNVNGSGGEYAFDVLALSLGLRQSVCCSIKPSLWIQPHTKETPMHIPIHIQKLGATNLWQPVTPPAD